MGPTVCKMLVEKMAGESGVGSEINKETTFLIKLPVSMKEDDRTPTRPSWTW